MLRSEDGSLEAFDRDFSFSQYADLEQSYEERAEADVMLSLTELETELDAGSNLRIKVGFTGQYVIYDRPMLETVEDAYSNQREIRLITQQLVMPVVLETRQKTINAVQPLKDQEQTVVDITFAAAQPQVRNRGEQEMELSGLFQVITQEETGELVSHYLRWEDAEAINAGDTVQLLARGSLSGTAHCHDRAVQADMVLDLLAVMETDLPMVTGLELGEKKQPDSGKASIIVCAAGEEDLWSLAKRCGSTMELISKINGLNSALKANR
jgi:hypothetical protein